MHQGKDTNGRCLGSGTSGAASQQVLGHLERMAKGRPAWLPGARRAVRGRLTARRTGADWYASCAVSARPPGRAARSRRPRRHVPPAASAPRSTAAAGAHGPAPAASPWPGPPPGAPPGLHSPPACPAAALGAPAAVRAPTPLAGASACPGLGSGSAAWPRTCRVGGAPPSRGAAPRVRTAPCSASAAATATSSRASSPTATWRHCGSLSGQARRAAAAEPRMLLT